nr:phosphate ABC transporter, permease protein PstA [Gammaproteobacteria bacterium]
MKRNDLKSWIKSGAPGVWMSGGAVAIAIIMTLGLLAVIAVRGLGHFWPADVLESDYRIPGQEPRVLLGEVVEVEEVPR